MPPRLPLSARPSQPKTVVATTQCIRLFSQTCPNQLRRLPRWRRTKLSNEDMRDYIAWVGTEGIKYKDAATQPNYLQLSRTRRSGAAADAAQEAENADAQDGGEATAASDEKGGQREGKKVLPRTVYTPFPLNPYFKSQSVLGEAAKEAIYEAVAVRSRDVRDVSTQFRVSMERVAAVVRMKQMERDWLEEGKKVVPYFSRKIMKMLPQTPYSRNSRIETHESINDLPVHSATTQQIFWPTSESREFTRIDAGQVFQQGLLPADMRIPHPQQVEAQAAAMNTTRSMAMERMRQDLEHRLNLQEQKRVQNLHNDKTLVATGKKYDFRIADVNVEWVGKNGRSRKGVGYRYGMPHEDRKRGLIKIPTSVP